MARVAHPIPDGHSRPHRTGAQRRFVFVPVTQQRGMTIRYSQFPRHGRDGEQRGQAFEPLPPIEMSRGGMADILELVPHLSPVFSHHSQRKPQLQGRGFRRKSRFQPPHLLGEALRALDGAMDLGDFIPATQLMHGRPVETQHPRDLGVGFVQVTADDFEPLTGQGMLPLGVRVDLHRPAFINAFFAGNSRIIPNSIRVVRGENKPQN
jgi:hypothetical protein